MKTLLLSIAFACILIGALEAKPRQIPNEDSESVEECVCLNGGTCAYFRLYGRPYRCVCPLGYAGEQCEIDIGSKCYDDTGKDYRGIVSKTNHGRECLYWDAKELKNSYFNAHRANALELGLGRHNYCRNPSNGRKPWCYFKSGRKVLTMHCDVPQCEKVEPTVPVPTCGQRQHKMYKVVRGGSTPIESQPWMAALYQISRRHKQENFLCGASLINPCWVMTAAHCFPDADFVEPKDYVVILGKSNLDETNLEKEQKFLVEKIIRHENFNDLTGALDNDITLIKIRSTSGQCASLTNSVQTICLPPSDLKLREGTKCEIAGFGKESYNSIVYSQLLKSASVQLISQQVCQSDKYYGKLLNNNMFCAGDPEWKVDACKGDSGGPLICEYNGQMALYGIISWGEECAKEHKPGVYTRITQYLPWINEKMAEDNTPRSKKILK
ncbi:urokinase-type plasminogen activator [Pelobates fuscus]|uniref:urokinase-type plasminogen activator n=1 Tax=Pelobates fuscus TaxID=191477 RepID=UPI002FE4DE28